MGTLLSTWGRVSGHLVTDSSLRAISCPASTHTTLYVVAQSKAEMFHHCHIVEDFRMI